MSCLTRSFATRVAFDTFDNKEATDFSLTLRASHTDYQFQRLSRTFLCGTDDSYYSATALEWLFEELVEDNDEIVCLRAIDPTDKIRDSPESVYRQEAHAFMERIESKNHKNKKISLTLEFALGKVQDMIQRMIQIYEPSLLVVGTRGKSVQGFRGLIGGSVSKYCLHHSPVPVIVVRPTQKREQRKARREADSSRQAYKETLLTSSNPKYYTQGSTGDHLPPDIPWYMKEDYFGPIARERSPSRDPITRSRSPFKLGFGYFAG